MGLAAKKYVNLTASCILMLLVGTMYAMGVFTQAVEAASPKKSGLGGVWTSSIPIMTLLSAPAMIISGIYLDGSAAYGSDDGTSPRTGRARVLGIAAAASYAALAVAAAGVSSGRPMLITFGVSLQGVAPGIFYLTGLELLATWTPERVGLAMGCGQMSFGFGVIVFSSAFNFLIESLGCVSAIYCTSFCLTLASVALSLVIEWPRRYTFSKLPASNNSENEKLNQLHFDLGGRRIPWERLPVVPAFWQYMGTVYAAQAGFAFIPFFFEIGASFKRPITLLMRMFQAANLVSTFARLGGGMLADLVGWGNGFFACGSKNLMILLLLTQTILFALLIPLSNTGNFAGFMLAVIVIIIIFAAASCASAVLARDLFSDVNSASVFGIGAGVTMGVGEATSAALVSWTIGDNVSAVNATAKAFNPFYAIAIAWSVAGVICAVTVRPCEEAFEDRRAEHDQQKMAGRSCGNFDLNVCSAEVNKHCGIETPALIAEFEDYGSVLLVEA